MTEKQIELLELQEQINKMKNCANCKHFEIRIMKSGRQRFVCNKLHIQIFNPTTPCDKWTKKCTK